MFEVDKIKSKALVNDVVGVAPACRNVPLLAQSLGLEFERGVVATVLVASNPTCCCFDGKYIWVGHRWNTWSYISKVDVVAGTVVATVEISSFIEGVLFVKGYIWVASTGIPGVSPGGVTKVDPVKNKVLGSISTTSAYALCFDGRYLWASRYSDALGEKSVIKIDIDLITVVAVVSVPSNPTGLCFDGRYLWVAHFNLAVGYRVVSKIDVVNNTFLATFAVGSSPTQICFDGQYLWVSNYNVSGYSTLSRIDSNLGAVVDFTLACQPVRMYFDGRYIWVAHGSSSGSNALISKFDPVSGKTLSTMACLCAPYGWCFDGKYLWVVFVNNADSKMQLWSILSN